MGKRASVTGTVLRARPRQEKAALARAFRERVLPLLESGEVEPVLDQVFAPEEAGRAHARLEENRSFGKLVLVWE
jgi:NADPH:quinone reductase-like Zn-dependent oxidoreductase